MASLKGKSMVIDVSTNDADYYTVANLKDASMSISGDNQDITDFGKDYIVRKQALKDVNYSLAGYYDSADTTGQLKIRSALVNDTTLYIKFKVDGTNGWKQIVKVASFEVSDSVDGVAEVSIELEGSDDISVVS